MSDALGRLHRAGYRVYGEHTQGELACSPWVVCDDEGAYVGNFADLRVACEYLSGVASGLSPFPEAAPELTT